ncbi:uncharacterized protein LOC143180084 [Calliopsis andreniformis]|uniref:uncharacterized protein LOC143180084 n=1 Tax=Calliopsis andreniformis TaxID=337506 RepID=UPI003FCDA1A6
MARIPPASLKGWLGYRSFTQRKQHGYKRTDESSQPTISLKYFEMKPQARFFVAVFVAFTVFVCSAVANPVATEELSVQEQKILHDCENSDYRTYIACLKRQKRHHQVNDNDHFNIGIVVRTVSIDRDSYLRSNDIAFILLHLRNNKSDTSCMQTCLTKCKHEQPSQDCQKVCSYCTRRTKHKHQIITEYETECVSGECTNTTKSDQTPVNISTNIEIHNHINPNNDTPPIPHIPPLIPVPQITLGWTYQQFPCLFGVWPCGMNPIDCSPCGNPATEYRCDTQCYTVKNKTVTSSNKNTVSISCTSPHCVGGSLG